MSNYYSMCDGKLRIAEALMERGWKVYGYSGSWMDADPGSDYPFHQGNWGGIAEKNGYVLVVDNNNNSNGEDITKYNPAGNLSSDDREKINKLEAMTQENGATAGEEENAKKLIEKIRAKVTDQPAYEVIGRIPGHMANPGKCKWHIEKAGKIFDKGTGITKYADMPESYMFDITTMQYTDRYSEEWTGEIGQYGERIKRKRELSDEQRKVINDFKSLILRFERVVNNMNTCGDGTAETEKAGQDQQEKSGYEEITVTEYKTEIKATEIETPAEIKDGMYFILKTGFNHGCSKGTVYKINSVRENPYNHKYYIDADRMNNKLNKVLTGRATSANSFDVELERFNNWINKGSISICELTEVQTPYEVKKWVKIDKTQKTYNSKPDRKQETEQPEQTSTILNYEYTITADTDTRDNSPLWVLKIADKLTPEQYKEVSAQLKAIKGYYSKFKHGFIFKYDPTNTLKAEPETTAAEPITEPEQNTEAAEQAEAVTDTADNIIDMSAEIITDLNISGSTIADNEQYKTMLYDYITDNNITITADIINYMKSESYNSLVNVLEVIQAGYWKPIKDGFIYDCHFKEWDIPITEIQEAITALNIPFMGMGDKIGFEGITAEQARQAKEISDINRSIFFIDAITAAGEEQQPEIITDEAEEEPTTETPEEPITEQQPETNNVIDFTEYKNNERENQMENFEDILSQFDNIEINNNSRITADDETFCKEQQEHYSKAMNTLNLIKNLLITEHGFDITADRPLSTQTSNNKFLSYYDFRDITEKFQKVKDSFIHNIIGHFTEKYKITIDSYKVCDKYKKVDIDYNTLLDEIFLQLGGYSFTEKALTEIKEALYKKVYNSYHNKFNLEVKNNKIVLNELYVSWHETSKYEYINGVRKDYPIYETGYRSDEALKPVLDALSWFEYGEVREIKESLYHYNATLTPDEFKNGVEMNGNKITKFKFYKNGRMDVTFKSSEYARQFAREFCKYTEKSA